MKFDKHTTVGNIVTYFPGSQDILKKKRIDFCCGGHRTIVEATSELSVDVDSLLEELNEQYQRSLEKAQHNTDWTTAPISDLVEHILQAHHAYLQVSLPTIGELTTKILRVHGGHHKEIAEVFQLFHHLKMELEAHLIKEETIQYPAIKTYLNTMDVADLNNAVEVIDELEEEHAAAGDLLKKLRDTTKDFAVPEDGCSTYHKTYQLLEDLEANTFTHIHLENNILFGRLKELSTK